MKKVLLAFAVLATGMATFTSCCDDEARDFPVINIATDAYTVVQGGTVTIAPTFSNLGANTTYKWTNAANEVLGTGESLVYRATEAGTQLVTLEVANGRERVSRVFTITVKEDLRTLTFEGEAWTALIDEPQYGGTLLYGDGGTTPVEYGWSDANTGLASRLTASWGGLYGYSEGGVAISNYVDADTENHATYAYQLAVPVANGSSNFAVVYCDASIYFADGKEREIRSMDVAPTTYQLGVTTYGDGYATSLAEEGELTAILTGYDAKGNVTGTVNIDMAKDGELLTTWKTMSLSALGKVASVQFTMTGTDLSSYGLKHPKYFAFDNVVVNYYAE